MPNQFRAKATGGVVFVTGALEFLGSCLEFGVQVPAGEGAWSALSDRNAKREVIPVDGRDILERLSAVPIATWNYKTQDPSIRHIGPMAQDFYAAFDVGADERRISTIDSDGVALAAIQGLYDMVKENQGMIAHLESRPVAQQDRIDKLEARLAVLEARLASHTPAPFHAGLGVLVGVPAFAIFGLLALITHRRTQKAGVR